MPKVHPAETKWENALLKERIASQKYLHHYHYDINDGDYHDNDDPLALTVWKRSSMSFQGTDGFTVFDDRGKLAFRVDNYSRKKGGLVLMDGAGKPLITLKPQVFSLQNQWNAYRGEEGTLNSLISGKVFTMRSKSTLFHNVQKGTEAEVFLEKPTTRVRKNEQETNDRSPDFIIEGCFWRRSCRIRGSNGEVVANIARKKVNDRVLLGDDVFSLVVQTGFDAQLVMSFVVVLDRICVKPYAPILCS